ncbi:NB-ARC domain-containing protein [Streptomyces microflavus]|uniref:NB-ARC domain-containing protein n=2 Tax=Streptomyces microflavus TaxID=1919 RepID=UPI0022544B06|nr:NB-ARC domain-containing protein [Streptomyces microflavus]MCX4657280.1 NB-ARC domain-containing protein [Streptomyces microflavus]
MRAGVWAAGVVALASLAVVLAIVLALAGNAATSTARWPGIVDELRQHPWWSVGVFGVLAVMTGGAAARLQLRPPAEQNDPPPPPAPVMPQWFVDRAQTKAAVTAVCHRGRARAVSLTTSLSGAGGFGKTTLANAVTTRKKVRRHFRSRIYPVTIGRDVRGRAAIAAKVAEVTRFITGDTTEFDDPNLAGAHLGRLLDQRPRTLLVLDDVWEPEQLAPFLQGGDRCIRLVTTRNPTLLPPGTQLIRVDQMSQDQARAVLLWELPPLPTPLVDALLETTGRWALLLRLTNRLIAERCASGADPTATAEGALQRLRDSGPAAVDDPAAAWDLDDPHQRNQAIRPSIEAATTLLPPGGPDRFTELGIFAEDESIPIPLIAQLWQASGALTEDQTRALCRNLERLSLLSLNPANGGTVTLHDVIRDHLRNTLGPAGLTRTNRLLTDTLAAGLPTAGPLATDQPGPRNSWWQLTDGYLLDHLIDHLIAAEREALAEALAGDIRWVEARLTQRGPTAPTADLTRIGTPHSRHLARSLAQTTHLLTPTNPPHALTGVLHTRLDNHPHWQPQITAHHTDPRQRPCLTTLWPLPDAPPPALERTLTGHTSTVNSVAISPDGTWLATTSYDETVRVWDRATGTCTTTLTGHTDTVYSVAISPDGTWLATTSWDETVRVWDRATGTCTTTLTGHTEPVTSVAISPDGTWLATTSYDETVRVWDRATGTCTTTLTGHTEPVTSVAISPDGTWLATTSYDETVRVWDRATGTCTTTLTGHTNMVTSVAISPDGTWLATTSYDKTARIWDRATGTCTTTLTGHTNMVTSVAISPDGTWLATTSSDETARNWDLALSQVASTLTGHTDTVNSVAISPDGTWLATTSWDETARIWDRTTGTCTTTLTGHTDTVTSVAISPDGTWLATTSSDETARIWDRATGTCTTTLTGHTDTVTSVAISPDGTWLATTSSDETARIWDRATGTCTTTLTGHTRSVYSVAISPDGTWLATTSYDKTARIWDRTTGTCTTTLTGHTEPVYSVAISPDGTWLATTSYDKTARIWDRATGTCTTTLTGHTEPVYSVAISPDGTWLATTSYDGTVQIWNVADRSVVAIARAEGALISSAWGSRQELVVGGKRGLYLFELLT